MDLLFGTALFCACTLAFTGFALWVRHPDAAGLRASSFLHCSVAIASVGIWTAAIALVLRGLFEPGGITGPQSVAALALVILTIAALRALDPRRRLKAYAAPSRRPASTRPDPDSSVRLDGSSAGSAATALRKAA